MSAWTTLCKLLEEAGAQVTFSANCHSGLASYLGRGHQCGCWRCMKERGETPTEETERKAASDSAMAKRLMPVLFGGTRTTVKTAYDFIGLDRTAWFSTCGRYRYRLDIQWDPNRPIINFLMLNPSTADELNNDPTVERCERRARAMGFGAVIITNLFALRSTDPNGLLAAAKLFERRSTDPNCFLAADDPVGRDNDIFLSWVSHYCAHEVVCAWGTRPNPKFVAERMRKAIPLLPAEKLRVLKLSKDGFPCHPLYLSYSLAPVPWGLSSTPKLDSA